MLEEANTDRRSRRRDATRREILDAAWETVRRDGLAALSLRDLARQVGLQAPSLYAYFPAKHAIYDAMFLEANTELLERMERLEQHGSPRDRLLTGAIAFATFCTEDPARYQLLFQRTIPGFEPSSASYEPAVRVLELSRQRLAAVGVTEAASFDVFTALMTGITDQQISNDPGGDRWLRLIPDAVDMYLHHHGRPE